MLQTKQIPPLKMSEFYLKHSVIPENPASPFLTNYGKPLLTLQKTNSFIHCQNFRLDYTKLKNLTRKRPDYDLPIIKEISPALIELDFGSSPPPTTAFECSIDIKGEVAARLIQTFNHDYPLHEFSEAEKIYDTNSKIEFRLAQKKPSVEFFPK